MSKFERLSLLYPSTLPLSIQQATMAFSFAALPYHLSRQDKTLLNDIQSSSLLPSLATPGAGELVQLYKTKKREETAALFGPYADLLELELKELLKQRKSTILQKLRESKDSSFSVDLFSWKTVSYFESLSGMQQRVGDMTPTEKAMHAMQMRERRIQIEENGWESTFGVECRDPPLWESSEDCTFWAHYPKKVDSIFRFSDLAQRLSLALGANFFPSIRWERVEDAGDESLTGFYVYKKTLYVRYYPFGVNKNQMDKLLTTAKKEAERSSLGKKTGFCAGEYGVGSASLCVLEDDYAGMPPLVSATDKCFCGCADDDSE
jgi:hypothetical protein